MSIFNAPLTNADGKVRVYQAASGQVPAGAVQFRGLWVTPNNVVCVTADTGQDRFYYGGLAFEKSSGLLLVKDTGVTPTVPMDGMNADQTGALELKIGGVVDVIHQGVGLAISAPGGVVEGDDSDPPVTFSAPLEYGIAGTGGLTGTPVRNSLATYWAQDGTLRIAGVNEIRQEFQNGQPLGTLMEPANTNKCTVFNANPDESLTNYSSSGDEARVVRRVYDPELIAAAGLDRVCTDGYLVELDNSAGSVTSSLIALGPANNTNIHSASAYVALVSGPGSMVAIGYSGAGNVSVAADNTLKRISYSGATVAASAASVYVNAGQVVRVALIQSEEQPLPTSTIITQGAAGTRAVDMVSWPLTDPQGRSILNQIEGMVGFLWRPGYSNSDLPTSNVNGRLLTLLASNFIRWRKDATDVSSFFINDGTNDIKVDVTEKFVAGKDYLVTARWTGANLQIGYKYAGTTTWGNQGAYDGAFTEDGFLRLSDPGGTAVLPEHMRSVYLWSQDKGTAWLDSFFSGVAN